MNTLNDLIVSALGTSEEDGLGLDSTFTSEDLDGVLNDDDTSSAVDLEDAEKLAEALDHVGRTGLANMLKEAAAIGTSPRAGSPETNMGHRLANTHKKQVQPHRGAPPMDPPGFGMLPNNMDSKPGKSGGSIREVDTAKQGLGDHHSALSSNEAAISYTKKEMAKQVAPALNALFDEKAFADPMLGELLDNTESDKNIHAAGVKHASDNDVQRDLLRAELHRRLSARTAGSEAAGE